MNMHLMIDLETLDNGPTSKVMSAGAVLFDASGKIHSKLYRVLDVDLQPYATMSHDTVMWWFGQAQEAREAIRSAEKTSPKALITMLKLMVGHHKGVQVWANGADFDLPILRHMATSERLDLPWKFWNHRCYRTVRALHGNVKAAEREGTYHNALDDALHQAQHLISIHRSLEQAGLPGVL